MYKLRNMFLAGILSIGMVLCSMPMELLAQEAVQEEEAAPEQSRFEVVSFEELTEEVSDLEVPVGTAFEDLELPKTLTVSCRPYKEGPDDGGVSDNDPGDDKGGVSDNDPGDDKGGVSDNDPGDDKGGGVSDNDPGDENGGGGDDNGGGEDKNLGDENGEGGDDKNPGDENGEGGEDKNPGDDDGMGEDKNPVDDNGGGETGTGGNESNPGGGTGEGGNENNPGGETGTDGNESGPGSEPAGETFVVQTFEVLMKEYRSQPEIEVKAETLTQGGETADSDGEAAAEQEAGGENADGGSGPDAGTGTETGTDTGAGTETDTETAVIEDITWQSAPEYDGDTEGCYLFTPVLPETYVLAEGVGLPEITVMVGEGLKLLALEPFAVATPGVGTISTDTVWNGGTLSNGELIVEPGVTLTINGGINVTGKVTIKGGGTIKRGNASAYLKVSSGAELTVGEITLEGSSISASDALIFADKAKILLDDGCRIQNCIRQNYSMYGGNAYSGAALFVYMGEATLNDVYIEGCRGPGYGGAICLSRCKATVNSGTYRNNRDGGPFAGSVIYNIVSKLYVYGGNFIDNTAEGSNYSGCITDIACTYDGFTNETHIYGGYFEGNKKASQGFGGGALFFAGSNDPHLSENAIFEIAGDVRFCGDGVEGSGMDGFFLGYVDYSRKISVGTPFTSPVYAYLKAKEGYVIAKGSGGYILTEKDMKQLHFTDVNKTGKKWYAWLNKDTNEIYLSEKQPPYGLYVYYSSNGATGEVKDDTEYASGAEVTVKPADALSREGYRFTEWNTKPDGKGTSYSPGSTFQITEDTTLYAIFEEGKVIRARFYSGAAGSCEVLSEEPEEDAESVTFTAPALKDMGDWTKVGWDEATDGYEGSIAPDTSLTISKNTSYYGIYKKDVTLSYDANGGKEDKTPESGTAECRANVHDKITYDMPGFSVAQKIDADKPNWVFVGWNTKKDGTGELYQEGDIIKISADTTLYAVFVKPPYADFYSGAAGDYEKKGSIAVEGEGIATTGKIITPHLKELAGMTGWEESGWDENEAGWDGTKLIKPDSTIVLDETEDGKPYYGVYKKTATLSYQVLNHEYGSGSIPADSTQTRSAKVNKTKVLYQPESETPDAFTFGIAPDLTMEGSEFLGWNTRADGNGDFYRKDDPERNQITITEDTVLYGIFRMAPNARFFSGAEGSYETVESVFTSSGVTGELKGTLTAPALKEMEGWGPVGWSRSATGYAESVESEGGQEITISEDTDFYGIYKKKVELTYDVNGWVEEVFDKQSGYSHANVHGEITCEPAEFTVGHEISREGYTFRGWSLEKEAGGVCHRPEDTITLTDSATVYAQMVDDIPPVLGEAAYNEGSRDVGDWKVRKKDMVLTVPVTEKGSGVEKIVYTFTPENGEPVTGEAMMEDAGVPEQPARTAAVWLEAVPDGGQDAGNRTAGATGGEVGTADGQIHAKVTIAEDYKGTISLMCRDKAGNESPEKLLTAQGGGVIVEDNAPLIRFAHKGIKDGRAVVEVTVYDDADEDSSRRVTGGIAAVSWRTDDRQEQSVTDKGFADGIVESCTFNVEVAGAGEHTVKVTAVDNAGNESSRSTNVRIAGEETTVITAYTPPAGDGSVYEPPTQVRETAVEEASGVPTGKEPKTGDAYPNVAVYATMAMISGLLYIVMYFSTEQNRMTEEDKKEIIARLIAWAEKGGRLRRYAALVQIFFVLVYYHSIGKYKEEHFEWSLIYMTHM